MTQARMELSQYTKRVLDVVKGKYGLSNRNEALERFALECGSEFVDPPLNEKLLVELDEKYSIHVKKNGFKAMKKKEFNEVFD